MASNLRDMDDGVHGDPGQLIARATGAETRGRARLSTAIDDFFLAREGRLDDRMRTAVAQTLAGLIGAVERALTAHAARLLNAREAVALAARVGRGDGSVLERLATAGVLRDSELMRELIARAQQDVIGDALPAAAPPRADDPSLLTRLANHSDSVVAAAAAALLAAESRRRGGIEGDLRAELFHRLIWWVVAALRDRFGDAEDLPALDRALTDAALRSLAAHDEGDRMEAVALRLAAAYDAAPRDLPDLLVEALGDRRIALFTALLAHALGLEYEQARDVVTDPDGGQLWLMLRALDAGRTAIARIGLALCEADGRRDLDGFAESLDPIMAISAHDARAALAPMKLHPDFRAALAALAGAAK
ncbi:DUF2336 domain-containing protein [Sphingomonas sp. PB4P5]|uniref:DUF2336 domain-containing protein n=1 Tax=Parasphingomonas puruogangriensis TaxID=3096155 RepID=UPI002FCA9CB1